MTQNMPLKRPLRRQGPEMQAQLGRDQTVALYLGGGVLGALVSALVHPSHFEGVGYVPVVCVSFCLTLTHGYGDVTYPVLGSLRYR